MAGATQRLAYESHVALLRCVNALGDVAAQHPSHWRRFCAAPDNGDAMPQLLRAAARARSEEVVLVTLRLLIAALPHSSASSSSASAASASSSSARVSFVSASQSALSHSVSDPPASPPGPSASAPAPTAVTVPLEWLLDASEGLLRTLTVTFLLEFNAAPVREAARRALQVGSSRGYDPVPPHP